MEYILLILIAIWLIDKWFYEPKRRRKAEDERLKNIYKQALKEHEQEKDS